MVPSPGFQSRFFVLANENRTQDAGHALLRQGRNPKVRKNSGVIHLLGIESTEQLILSNHRGNLFENLVVTEIIKRYEALEKRPRLYYWRDSNRKEIDLIIEKGGKPYYLIEIKSSATFRPEAFSTIDSIAPEMGVPCERRFVVYGGSDSFGNRHGRVIGFRNLGELVE